MNWLFSIDQIRAAEQPLLEAQTRPDELMQSAAAAVADACEQWAQGDRYLLFVGPGGNGGDALYAGALAAMKGKRVDAYPIVRTDSGEPKMHERAAETFTTAGGHILTDLPKAAELADYGLIVDGMFGLGNRVDGIPLDIARLLHANDHSIPAGDSAEASACSPENYAIAHAPNHIPVLAVDLPSGVDANTAITAAPTQDGINSHVTATATVTFGGMRRAHGISAECGHVSVSDIHLDDGRRLSDELATVAAAADRPLPSLYCVPLGDSHSCPAHAETQALLRNLPGEPSATDDKYSGGVVGIYAGSEQFPGAGVLSCTGAVRTTNSMVRYVGGNACAITASLPEVVIHPDRFATGRVQARLLGPGRGTDRAAKEELVDLLDTVQPLILDADALTIISKDKDLVETLRKRLAPTVCTPHGGEFERLAKPVRELGHEVANSAEDRLQAARDLAVALDCTVLLKGRFSVIANPHQTVVVDYGSSWAATAGSGDVLSGIVGAILARDASRRAFAHGYAEAGQSEIDSAEADYVLFTTALGAIIHAVAAFHSAETPYGRAPTSASRIAEAIPGAIAHLTAQV
ncbi:NAD(P)H-hydrate dehydratase [Corynebacterium falsenii]|uniref:bifunctional ADP-dependent NAD(P)H-hydrate dehydratase/NAD(P)H-hydrate epimerase n=1 Tax=Corynebacterium falsenii TaxID=108486 RepID=UPI00234DCF58|nr:bifunctional ADP-dependent NAD(P)H-hydrate dehydratase/NAD(P)H-hydrate epimerase [Corynebacterium falsenii]MDC7104661.1 NAD(P)H-hydrate dehydratase [Corynebacterium falsenii]